MTSLCPCSDSFQQSFEFVPQVQFLDSMVDIPAARRGWYAQTVERFHRYSSWLVSTRPLLCIDRCIDGAILGSTVDTLRQFEEAT